MNHHHLTATKAANINDRLKTDILTLYKACERGSILEGENPARDFFIDLSVELGQKGILVSMVDYAINPAAMIEYKDYAVDPTGGEEDCETPVVTPPPARKLPVLRGRRTCAKRMRINQSR